MNELNQATRIDSRSSRILGAVVAALLLASVVPAAAQAPIEADTFDAAPVEEALPDLALEPVDPFAPPADATPLLNSVLPPRPAVAAAPASLSVALEEPEAVAERPAEKKTPSPKSSWLDLSGEKWTVKLGGHMQADYVTWPHADDPPVPARNYFEFRRLRLLADGTGYGVFDFRIQIDIEPESGDGANSPIADIKDAYLSMNEIPVLQRWRIGNFFVPFSLEQVTNDTNNIFMERSIPTQGIFAADREVGMAVYGRSDDQNFTWTSGIFIDNISESLKERVDDNMGRRMSGRLTWLPYYDEPSNGRYLVHLGTGILYTNDQDDLIRFRARPQIHEGPFLIDTGNVPGREYTTGNIEFATVWGQVSVQSEWFLSQADRNVGPTATLHGGYVYLSFFVTGENRVYERFGQHGAQFARNVPFSNFFLTRNGCGPGALELKARTSYLGLDELNAGHYNDLTVGFNWYWTDRIRWMFDWIHPITSANSAPFGKTESDIVAMRFDFNF